MKRIVAYRFVIRLLSCAAVLFLLCWRWTVAPSLIWDRGVGDAFFGGCLLLLLYPLKGESALFAVLQAVLFVVLMAAGECLPRQHLLLWTCTIPLLLMIVLWERRRSMPRLVTKENRLFYTCLVLMLRPVGNGIPLVFLYVLMYVLCYYGSTFSLAGYLAHFKRRTEKGKCDPAQMRSLFERAEQFLVREQPFLNANYREDEMARALYTNRVYLSQTINAVSGMNFKTLLNSYRVRYAMALMREKPALNIKQVAINSGFNSSNVFVTSFRQITGENPQKFLSRMRERGP